VDKQTFLQKEGMFAKCAWIGAGRSAIDELKSAKANDLMLSSNQTTLAQIAADNGDDWEELLEQRAEEKRMMDELGITPVERTNLPFGGNQGGQNISTDFDDEDTTNV
jgi:capsid protein